ncbi:hypothetical protein ACQP2F_33590 [Actinoplanes sp. CA-030573]|uniref:hypothetical protein n=1 Tax=Actinoplanes sp. CA-030573 TaxID=3239898 RepID=UPI003D94213F
MDDSRRTVDSPRSSTLDVTDGMDRSQSDDGPYRDVYADADGDDRGGTDNGPEGNDAIRRDREPPEGEAYLDDEEGDTDKPGRCSSSEEARPRPEDSSDRAEVHEAPHEVETNDFLTGYIADLAGSGLETLLWHTAEGLAATFVPGGAFVIRGVYLTKQLYSMLTGLQSGRGFMFKMSVPGLNLPWHLELVACVKIGPPHGVASEGVQAEFQIFQPWLQQVDVEAVHGEETTGRTGHMSPPAPVTDPWRIWLSLLGEVLIRNLAWALSNATSMTLDDIREALLAQRYKERDDTPGFPA